jgi:hypothetical protein
MDKVLMKTDDRPQTMDDGIWSMVHRLSSKEAGEHA